jgi:hypothetical protein
MVDELCHVSNQITLFVKGQNILYLWYLTVFFYLDNKFESRQKHKYINSNNVQSPK